MKDFIPYIVVEGIERFFTRPNFFDLESQRKKEGVGGLSFKTLCAIIIL